MISIRVEAQSDPPQAYKPFQSVYPPFLPYRDATCRAPECTVAKLTESRPASYCSHMGGSRSYQEQQHEVNDYGVMIVIYES